MNKYVNYKNRYFTVYEFTGDIEFDENSYIIDKLDPNLPSLGRFWMRRIRDKYDLSPEEYLTIVMYEGDESRIPMCEFSGCANHKKFIKVKSKEVLWSTGCCERHSRTVAQTKNFYKRFGEDPAGLTKIGISKGVYSTEEHKELMRDLALKQVKEGKHPWAGENGTELNKRRATEGTNFFYTEESRLKSSIRGREKMKNGTHQFLDKSVMIKADRSIFLNKGSIDDECYLYIATYYNRPDIIKIGVTVDPEYRINFHHMTPYESLEVLVTSGRRIIAELEYEVKMKFMNHSVEGNESFPVSMRDDILNFIIESYNLLKDRKFNDYPDMEYSTSQ